MIKSVNSLFAAAGFLLACSSPYSFAADTPPAPAPAAAAPKGIEYRITEDMPSLTVTHNGKSVTIMRSQDPEHTINPAYAKTTRKCPPFCVNPISIAPGVETIGEVEMLDYLKRASAGEPVVVIDSRTEDWVAKGTIPGSVNIPWTHMGVANDPANMATVLEFHFGVERVDKFWDFRNAKTLVLFCNGMWCGQSPTNIRNLLAIGYPANKIKWYRGGMQDWEALGLTTVKP